MLDDVFEDFWNMCLKVYDLVSAHFISAVGLAWPAPLKKTEVKLDLLADIDMLLMTEKGIRGEICHSIYRYAKANNKYINFFDKTKKLSYHQYWDVNNLYGRPCGIRFWEIILSESIILNDDFIINYNCKKWWKIFS